jgi:hypothetical protein
VARSRSPGPERVIRHDGRSAMTRAPRKRMSREGGARASSSPPATGWSRITG